MRRSKRTAGSHLGKDVADDLAVVIFGHVRQLRPREAMVEVVLQLVVLGKAQQVAVLHVDQIFRLENGDA